MAVFTYRQAAKHCMVAPHTILRWHKGGQLKGYYIPGSTNLRIPQEQLIKFMKENHISLRKFLNVLFVSENASLFSFLDVVYATRPAASLSQADILAHELQPDCVVVDFAIGKEDALQVCENMRRDFPNAIVVALVPEDMQVDLNLNSITEALWMPMDHNRISGKIDELTAVPAAA